MRQGKLGNLLYSYVSDMQRSLFVVDKDGRASYTPILEINVYDTR